MPLLFGLMLQAIASTPPERVDLTVPQPCAADRSAEDEIIVCAERRDGLSPYRVKPAPAPQPEVPKAEVQLADGVSASAETEQVDVGGFPSNRMLVRFKIKF